MHTIDATGWFIPLTAQIIPRTQNRIFQPRLQQSLFCLSSWFERKKCIQRVIHQKYSSIFIHYQVSHSPCLSRDLLDRGSVMLCIGWMSVSRSVVATSVDCCCFLPASPPPWLFVRRRGRELSAILRLSFAPPRPDEQGKASPDPGDHSALRRGEAGANTQPTDSSAGRAAPRKSAPSQSERRKEKRATSRESRCAVSSGCCSPLCCAVVARCCCCGCVSVWSCCVRRTANGSRDTTFTTSLCSDSSEVSAQQRSKRQQRAGRQQSRERSGGANPDADFGPAQRCCSSSFPASLDASRHPSNSATSATACIRAVQRRGKEEEFSAAQAREPNGEPNLAALLADRGFANGSINSRSSVVE